MSINIEVTKHTHLLDTELLSNFLKKFFLSYSIARFERSVSTTPNKTRGVPWKIRIHRL